ncbi:phosphoenolpyruvate synthase [candidate division WOR-1 bacterium RIFCSPHIGHO2_01_FULL_53_15]|uniref:Phosphoenolpyruvate synthase n=1 Tax=candidate division WOR-1 bacterium RIFCSPHIGHO2_01_FULL_53_15 TaxID=1802564 RepID=A0A1F4Q1L1_UNCSA|nr:MAG: phosphoenolpyruvate synthase [candidate division WOR-1 bacterium RIFCSPHIGHO2_01_FULL_53_15]OGC13909.1 MAG: phosphoenolpyruvate synthase [candidate division WOR-1 bacterium RIFCSPHIGHO2_02_FULL_53_26]
MSNNFIRWFGELGVNDVPLVGGKNASLGEMIAKLRDKGVPVPDGFAATADAYWRFIEFNKIGDGLKLLIAEYQKSPKALAKVGKAVRGLFLAGQFPDDLRQPIVAAYRELSRRYEFENADVAVRSSATAEDLPDASFAGQQETYLNVTGEEALLDACRKCFASLFTDRAITYRAEKKFDHLKVALSIGVQKMVRSDLAGSGVMFSLDTDTGFRDVVIINAGWGLGENIVQGTIDPDEYLVYKPLLDKPNLKPIIEKARGGKEKKLIYSKTGGRATKNVATSTKEKLSYVLSDEEILQLSRWAVIIEKHYGKPMDIEWAKEGKTGQLFIVQARPETVESRKEASVFKEYRLLEKGKVLLEGMAVGDAVVVGKAQVIKDVKNIARFEPGSILVTGMTDPDWVPIMRQAAGIITDHGGRTSHAAIVSRELGIPAIVGTGVATRTLKHGQPITLSNAEGEKGFVYDGRLKYEAQVLDLKNLPKVKTQIMMNLGEPAAAFRWWRLPCRGIGLARMEFIINNEIKIHPMALVKFKKLKDAKARRLIEKLTAGYKDKTEYFVDKLARGISMLAAAQYPHEVIVRLSDFKTNEYANLIGGAQFEAKEENPMIGFRGASRYYNDKYREGFALECRALKRVREEMGLTNVIVMVPFCRTIGEADNVLAEMAKNGLKRGENSLQVYVMAEIPSNIILADQFSERFDGFSIGSNDLTQLTLGIDRDSEELAKIFDERNDAVKRSVASLIEVAHKNGVKVGICGQAPSDYPEFAEFLVKQGIDSMSLNPDSVIGIVKKVAAAEKRKI